MEEAAALADRVLVLDAGRVAVDQPVALDRPRDPSDLKFVAHLESLLAALGIER